MSLYVEDKLITDDDTVNTVDPSALLCRGCLKMSGEMKNIYEWGIDEDFFRYTDVPKNPSEGISQLLCEECEINLINAKTFKDRCQQSDKILKARVKKKSNNSSLTNRSQITSVIRNKQLLFLITAPDPDDKIRLNCPHKLCSSEFHKKTLLLSHLRKAHNISNDFEVDLQFYCTEKDCVYNLASDPTKYFSGRKYLNQHYTKMHKDKIYSCEACNIKFSKITDYYRHLKSCNLVYECSSCNITYTSKESYLVHLMRKHPDLHARYKEERKNHKRLAQTNRKESEVVDIVKPMKIRKGPDHKEGKTHTMGVNKEIERQKDTDSNIMRFPPLQLNLDVFESTIPPRHYVIETDADATESVVNTAPLVEPIIQNGESEFANEIMVAEDYIIEECAIENEISTAGNQIEDVFTESAAKESIVAQESLCKDGNNEIDGLKKSSATQIPEDISNDVSLTSWSNRNYFEFQNEMSTQTVFEDLLSMKSQNGEDEIFFSESVSLSDIQTQTAPLEFGFSRCNKETQSCTSQTQSPDLSIKETQTCFCLYDSPKHNFRLFDSLSSSSSSNNFISTETQTADFKTLVHSDVLLSFSSAETQTCFDESGENSM